MSVTGSGLKTIDENWSSKSTFRSRAAPRAAQGCSERNVQLEPYRFSEARD
jgi:hypothetical protein